MAQNERQQIIAVRYLSEGQLRSLYLSTDTWDLKAHHPDIQEIQGLSDKAYTIVSELLTTLVGA